MEYSSIEEDKTLQNKWAILLSNLVDSEQNIENHVFPYVLSQLSSNEFQVLEKVYDDRQVRMVNSREELKRTIEEKPKRELEIKGEINKLEAELNEIREKTLGMYPLPKELEEIRSKIIRYELELRKIKNKIWRLEYDLKRPCAIPPESLKEFEMSNLIRLGLIKEVKEFYANQQSIDIPNERQDYGYTNLDLDIELESETEIILTQLGELFISACKEKKSVLKGVD